MLRKFWVWLFGEKPLPICPPRRRGVLSFYEIPRDDGEDRPSWMRRLMPEKGSSGSLDYTAVNLGGDFGGRPRERAERDEEIESLRKMAEGFEGGRDDTGEPEEMGNPY